MVWPDRGSNPLSTTLKASMLTITHLMRFILQLVQLLKIHTVHVLQFVRFEPRSGQTIDYKTGICCFSAKHTALRKKCKDWLTWNQDNVSRWGNMFISWLLILYKADLIIISLKIYLFSPWHSWKIAELALSNNHPVVICHQ
jgi:GH43 family beta-xylosidase